MIKITRRDIILSSAAAAAMFGLDKRVPLGRGYNVAVNMLSPGLLDVGLGRMLLPHRIAEYTEQCPAGRLGSAAEVAQAAVFLVSDDNSFMSGAKVVLDGGI